MISDFFKLPVLRALMKRQVCLLRLKSSFPRNVLYQDICDILCAELNGTSKTFHVFDEIAKADAPKGTSKAETDLKSKKMFIKAIEPAAGQLQERKSRIQHTAGVVQVFRPVNHLLFNVFIGFSRVFSSTMCYNERATVRSCAALTMTAPCALAQCQILLTSNDCNFLRPLS